MCSCKPRSMNNAIVCVGGVYCGCVEICIVVFIVIPLLHMFDIGMFLSNWKTHLLLSS